VSDPVIDVVSLLFKSRLVKMWKGTKVGRGCSAAVIITKEANNNVGLDRWREPALLNKAGHCERDRSRNLLFEKKPEWKWRG
jgi:hypothetical protein